jgi:hypothetical protein
MEIDRLLRVILTAVTAGDGLGFNRAFLLLVEEDGKTIRGRLAVGPAHADEAAETWRAMASENTCLADILNRPAEDAGGGDGAADLVHRLVFPLEGKSGVFRKCFEDGLSLEIDSPGSDPATEKIAEVIGCDHFLIVPLIAEGERLGAVVADNFITRRPIRRQDVRLLETLASQAALAITNASLHQRLRDRLEQLEGAHRRLSVNHLQLVKAERLVAMSGLAASVAHDIRSPLVSIGLMARRAAAGLPEEERVREDLEGIAERIAGLEEYLSDLVASTGRRREAVGVDVASLVEESLGMARGLLEAGGIRCEVNLNHGHRRLLGNPVELRQLLLNLLHNAVEAMTGGGTLTVGTEVVDDRLRISVEDTGCGIPEEIRPHLFSLFRTTKPRGSGMGLFVARRIVDGWGGRIDFETRMGEGTRFLVTLPSTPADGYAGQESL